MLKRPWTSAWIGSFSVPKLRYGKSSSRRAKFASGTGALSERSLGVGSTTLLAGFCGSKILKPA
jgi:hypothetical protein